MTETERQRQRTEKEKERQRQRQRERDRERQRDRDRERERELVWIENTVLLHCTTTVYCIYYSLSASLMLFSCSFVPDFRYFPVF